MLKASKPLSILSRHTLELRHLPQSLVVYTSQYAHYITTKPARTCYGSNRSIHTTPALLKKKKYRPSYGPWQPDDALLNLIEQQKSFEFKRLPLFDLTEAIEYTTEWYTKLCIPCLRDSEWTKLHFMGYSENNEPQICTKCFTVTYCTREHQEEHAVEHARTCENIIYLKEALLAAAFQSGDLHMAQTARKAMIRIPTNPRRGVYLRRCLQIPQKHHFSYRLSKGPEIHGEMVGRTTDVDIESRMQSVEGIIREGPNRLELTEGPTLDPSLSTRQLLHNLPNPDEILYPFSEITVSFTHHITRPPIFLFQAADENDWNGFTRRDLVELVSHTYKFVYALDGASGKPFDTTLPLTFTSPIGPTQAQLNALDAVGIFDIRRRYTVELKAENDKVFKDRRIHPGLAGVRISGLKRRSDLACFDVLAEDIDEPDSYELEAAKWREENNIRERMSAWRLTAPQYKGGNIPRPRGGREDERRARVLRRNINKILKNQGTLPSDLGDEDDEQDEGEDDD